MPEKADRSPNGETVNALPLPVGKVYEYLHSQDICRVMKLTSNRPGAGLIAST
jgi:hypothetical protein